MTDSGIIAMYSLIWVINCNLLKRIQDTENRLERNKQQTKIQIPPVETKNSSYVILYESDGG